MIVDAWAQHPTLRFHAHPMFDSLRRWTKTATPTAELPVAKTIEALNDAKIDIALISAWHSPLGALISNDEVASFVRESGGRLVGIGSVDLSRPAQVRAEVRRCIDELGFKGMRVLPWLWKLPPTDRLFYPLYAACCEAGVPFCTQIGHTGPLMPSEPGRPIYLDQVALDFPELTIVGGHIGYPWTDEAIAVASKHEHVYIDTSAYTCARYPAALVDFMRGHGRDKVLFGSNYPMMPPAQALSGLAGLELPAAIEQRFLGQTAQRVFRLE
jgi:uncharacterized protein